MFLRHARTHTLALFGTLVAIAVLLAGCGSTLETAKVRGADEVAVPIITVDQYIDLSDLQEEGTLASGSGAGTLTQRLLQDESFELSPMVDLLHERTYGMYAERLPVTVMPEQQVIRTDRYQNFQLLDDASNDERLQNLNRLLVPEGYKKYNLGQDALLSDRQSKMFGAVPDQADALLFVSAHYEMIEDNPFWYWFLPINPDRAYIESSVRMEMIDRDGNTILEISKSARSNNHVNTVGGVTTEPDEIQPLCEEATENAVAAIDKVIQEELSGS